MNAIKCTATALLLAALAGSAFGAGKSVTEVRKQIEMSMVLTGQIRIADDGQVQSLQIDRENEVPAVVGQVVRGSVSKWRFDPLKPGQTQDGATSMRVRVVAARAPEEGEDKFALRVVSASFGDTPEDEMPKSVSLRPPQFPMTAAYARAPATVYLVARIGRDGKVQEVFAEQVNLKAVGNERQMDQFRKQFAEASLAAAKRWTFAPPTRGAAVDADHWSVRVPVDFVFDSKRTPYGYWEAYVPGPRHKAPWGGSDDDATAGIDAVADDKIRMVGHGPRLLTPLPQG